MQLDKTPFFRKPVNPWYDSNFTCWMLIIIMIFIFAFAIVGVIVSSSNQNFLQHTWFPGFLAFLSLFLIIKILFRLKIRSQEDNSL